MKTAVEWLEERLKHLVEKEYFHHAKKIEKEQREKDFISGYKKRAELSNLIYDEASELSAKELFNQQEK
jgi:hypothetical protein